MKYKNYINAILAIALLFPILTLAQDKEKGKNPETLEELQTAIERVLKRTKTPAVGVALVNENGPVWVAGLGKADIAADKDADENTMFRIGSTSKMFVSLAILKLAEEGRVSLKDVVRDLVPDVEFENRWSDTHPILVEHLLEHTTGWDDIHMCEFAYDPSPQVSLKEGLDYHPHSRTSRWIPGTRYAYCNSGPPVAAYIVEKITGQSFEDYVKQYFFDPMGMEHMTYVYSDAYDKLKATLYDNGTPATYWNIIMRPSGSINASAKDMANMVAFFINGGVVDSVAIISEASLKRMETSSTTNGAKIGIQHGYGLSNYSSPYKSFVYRAHNGGVNGGLTELAYLPEYKVGYAFMINSNSSSAFGKISNLIREFQTRDYSSDEIISNIKLTEEQKGIAGLYEPASPRAQAFHYLKRILGIQRIWFQGDTLILGELIGDARDTLLPAGNSQFMSSKTGLTKITLVNDLLDGEMVQNGSRSLKPISAVQVYGQLIIGLLWLLLIPTTIVFGIIWCIRFWMSEISGGANVQVRLWPLLASCFAAASVVFILIGVTDASADLGVMSGVSVSIMVFTLGYGLASFWSVVTIIKNRNSKKNKAAYIYSMLVSAVHFIVSSYLFWHGVIGLRTWA